MYTFGRKENVRSLLEEVKLLEGAITCELSAQDAEAPCIAAEIQADVDSSAKEPAHHDKTATAKHAEQERCDAAIREEGRGRLKELQRNLADAKHELDVIHSPILILPYEVTAEIFNWHMLMGGSLAGLLLMCGRWTTLANSSPRIWSRIAVTNLGHDSICLEGSVICRNVNYLRLVLSRSQASTLQVQIGYAKSLSFDRTGSKQPSSLCYLPLLQIATKPPALSSIMMY